MTATDVTVSHILRFLLAAAATAATRAQRRHRMRQLLRDLTPEQVADLGIDSEAWAREAAKWFWEP